MTSCERPTSFVEKSPKAQLSVPSFVWIHSLTSSRLKKSNILWQEEMAKNYDTKSTEMMAKLMA